MTVFKNGCSIIKIEPKVNKMKYISFDSRRNNYRITVYYKGRLRYVGQQKDLGDAMELRDEALKQIDQGSFWEWSEKRRVRHPSSQSQRP